MSTIASPRPSLSQSSRRTSASTDTTSRSVSTSRPPAAGGGGVRRNKTALRDYYGLKTAAPVDGRDAPLTPVLDAGEESELDKASFDVDGYVRSLLAKQGLEGVLKVEAGLVAEIRNLDGEKKALVYDNYSKLIAATDTIRSMREKMDPMTPTTKTLSEDVGNIARTAAELSAELGRQHTLSEEGDKATESSKAQQQRQTVRWALNTPERLRSKMALGEKDEALQEWQEVSALLDQWRNVKGVDELRKACLAIVEHSSS